MSASTPEQASFLLPKKAIPISKETCAEFQNDVAGFKELARVSFEVGPSVAVGNNVFILGCGTKLALEALKESSRLPKDGRVFTCVGEVEQLELYGTYRSWDYTESLVRTTLPCDKLPTPNQACDLMLVDGLLPILPCNGVYAAREVYRTLKTNGTAIFNCWVHAPHLEAIYEATRLVGKTMAMAPKIRAFIDKFRWSAQLHSVVEQAGFRPENITLKARWYYVRVYDLQKYARWIWSFVAPNFIPEWEQEDEDIWDVMEDKIKDCLTETRGFQDWPGGSVTLIFSVNLAIATKWPCHSISLCECHFHESRTLPPFTCTFEESYAKIRSKGHRTASSDLNNTQLSQRHWNWALLYDGQDSGGCCSHTY